MDGKLGGSIQFLQRRLSILSPDYFYILYRPSWKERGMLVLSRKIGEKIVIGDDIVLTVVEIHRDKVKIGVDAPKDMRVFRTELLEDNAKKQEEKSPRKIG